jgi:hypothetical protein
MMNTASIVALLTVVQCVVACSLFDTLTDSDIREARRSAVLSQTEFRRIASAIARSSIIHANGKTVRYRLDGDGYRTDPWETAQVPPGIRNEVRNFIASGHAQSVFVNPHWVNFFIRGAGLAVSGVSVGVIVASGEELGCSEVVTSVKLDRRGVQCERLDDSIYFYLDR